MAGMCCAQLLSSPTPLLPSALPVAMFYFCCVPALLFHNIAAVDEIKLLCVSGPLNFPAQVELVTIRSCCHRISRWHGNAHDIVGTQSLQVMWSVTAETWWVASLLVYYEGLRAICTISCSLHYLQRTITTHVSSPPSLSQWEWLWLGRPVWGAGWNAATVHWLWPPIAQEFLNQLIKLKQSMTILRWASLAVHVE